MADRTRVPRPSICPRCWGAGKTTGSIADVQVSVTCHVCSGRGWLKPAYDRKRVPDRSEQ